MTDMTDQLVGRRPAPHDAEQIQALITEHAWVLDRGDVRDLPRFYTDDGVLLGLEEPLHGRPAIEQWAERRAALTGRRSRHVHTNVRLAAADTGADTASGTMVTMLYRHEGEGLGATVPLSVSDYDDIYRRVDGRWLIARREMRRAFADPDRVPPPAAAPAPLLPTAQVYAFTDMPLEVVREGLSRVAVRSDESIVTLNWFDEGFVSRGTHSHPFDQLSFVFSGALRFTVGDEQMLVPSGSVLRIPAGVQHTAVPVGSDRVLNVDVFAPIREDFRYLTSYQDAPAGVA